MYWFLVLFASFFFTGLVYYYCYYYSTNCNWIVIPWQ